MSTSMIEKDVRVEQSRNQVTVCLFCVPNENGIYNIHNFYEQIVNVLSLSEGLSSVALAAGDKPPDVIVEYFLVPQKGHSFFPNVVDGSGVFQQTLQDALKEDREHAFSIEAKQVKLDEYEADYFERMPFSGGNIIDFMKISALINYAECNHLQIDSNTIIHDYGTFYALTFGADKQQPQFVTNVYSTKLDFFTVNSKVVYLPQNSAFSEKLSVLFNEHLAFYQAKEEGLVLYNQVFSEALKESVKEEMQQRALETEVFQEVLRDIGLLDDAGFTIFSDDTIQAFEISRTILIRVLRSWGDKKNSDFLSELPVFNMRELIEGANCTFDIYSFKNLLQKHATPLTPDLEKHVQLFEKISAAVEVLAMKKYFNDVSNVSEAHRDFLLDTVNQVLEGKPDVFALKVREILMGPSHSPSQSSNKTFVLPPKERLNAARLKEELKQVIQHDGPQKDNLDPDLNSKSKEGRGLSIRRGSMH